MTYATELADLESYFATQWAQTTPVQYENAQFEPPADGSAFVRFWLLGGMSEATGYAGPTQRRYRHPGVIQIDIFTPQGIGAKPGLELADQAAAIFRGRRIGSVLCRNPALSKPVAESGYFRVTLSVTFQRDSQF